jgi:DNA-binding response OmpR family regulator
VLVGCTGRLRGGGALAFLARLAHLTTRSEASYRWGNRMAGETVLVVDNDEDFLTITGEMLRQAGFRVVTARDGDEGLERAGQLHPDLILLDWMMPAMDGFEVLDRLIRRKIPTRVIIVSAGFTREEDKKRALRAGACDYLIKGVDLANVVTGVRRAIAAYPTLDVAGSDPVPMLEQLRAQVDRLQYEKGEAGAALEDRKRQVEVLTSEVRDLKEQLTERISRHKLYNRYLSIFVALIVTGLVVAGFRGNPPWWALALVVVITIILNVPLEAATELFVRHGKGEAGMKLGPSPAGRDEQGIT